MITTTNNTVFELSSLWLEVTFAGELEKFHLVGVGEKLGSGMNGTWFPGQDQSRCEKQSEASEWVINVILTLQTDCLWDLFLSVPHHPSRGKDAKRNKEKTWQMYSWTRRINAKWKVWAKMLGIRSFSFSYSTLILRNDTNQVNKSEYENVHNRSCVFGPWTAYLNSNFECGPCG